MPRNGSGNYSLPTGINPVTPNTPITSAWANTTLADIASALSQSLARDGQTTPSANLPMGGFRHTNVSNPSARNQYASLGWVQDGFHIRATSVGGTNAVSAQLLGGATALQTGQIVQITPVNNNTGNVTLNINSIGAKPVRRIDGSNFSSGQWQSGYPYVLVYNGTEFRALNALIDTATSGFLPNWQGINPSSKADDNAVLKLTGGSLTGALNVDGHITATGSGDVRLNGPAGSTRIVRWNSSDSYRWALYATSAAETGGNAGSDLTLQAYNDDGTFLGRVFTANRSTRQMSIDVRPTFAGNTPWDNGNLPTSSFGRSLVNQSSASNARSALGLGTAATRDIGTSGSSVPLLNGENTWSSRQTFRNGSGAVISFTSATAVSYIQYGLEPVNGSESELRLAPYGSASWNFRILTSGDVEVAHGLSDQHGPVRRVTHRTATGSGAMAAASLNAITEKTNNTAYTWTFDSALGAASSPGDIVTILNSGSAGNITASAGSGVTMYRNGVSVSSVIVGPGNCISFLRANAANRWQVMG